MKAKYPIEAFALCVVFFSVNTAAMLMAGMLVICSACAVRLIRRNETTANKTVAALCGAVIFFVAAYFSFLFAGLGAGISDIIAFAAVSIGCGLYAIGLDAETDMNEIVYSCAIVLGCGLVFSGIREFAGSGKLFTFKLLKADFISSAYLKTMFGFIIAALCVGLANTLLKQKAVGSGLIAVGVGVVAAALTQIAGGGEFLMPVATAAGILVLVYSASFRTKYSASKEALYVMPLNLAVCGFAYMILSVL